MTRLAFQAALLFVLASCNASTATKAQSSGDPPFVMREVTSLDSPWAMAFLPGGTSALVTEKPGRIWLVELSNGRKQAIAGAPRVVLSSQGGLLDIKASPSFATDQLVYLT